MSIDSCESIDVINNLNAWLTMSIDNDADSQNLNIL